MNAFPTFQHVDSHCPCGYKLDSSTKIEGKDEGAPEQGDASVCLNCGQILVYQADLTMRKANREDIRELMKLPKCWGMIERAQKFILRRGRFA